MSVMARANISNPAAVTGYVLTAAPGPIVQGQTTGSLVIQRYDPSFTDHSGSGNALFKAGNDYRLRFLLRRRRDTPA